RCGVRPAPPGWRPRSDINRPVSARPDRLRRWHEAAYTHYPHKMPPEYLEVLIHQMAANGEGELSAGDTYIESFYPLAPDADERYVCAKFAMEEVDHFRRFARLLADLGTDLSSVVSQPRSSRRYFPASSMTVTYECWE